LTLFAVAAGQFDYDLSKEDRRKPVLLGKMTHCLESSLMSYGVSIIVRPRLSLQRLPLGLRVLAMYGFGLRLMPTPSLSHAGNLGTAMQVQRLTSFTIWPDRLSNRIQLTTDGHRVYLTAIESAFGCDIDYAMLVKMYGTDPREAETRYSPAKCTGIQLAVVTGNPDPKHISTSFVERQNWSVRTAMRRYTRLSNGFSRKIQNHAAAVALNYFAYNFIKIHRTLRVSPAMAAGVTDRLWEVSDLVALWESEEAKRAA
jgi:hypothetical protein